MHVGLALSAPAGDGPPGPGQPETRSTTRGEGLAPSTLGPCRADRDPGLPAKQSLYTTSLDLAEAAPPSGTPPSIWGTYPPATPPVDPPPSFYPGPSRLGLRRQDATGGPGEEEPDDPRKQEPDPEDQDPGGPNPGGFRPFSRSQAM